jgi:hypothetical protein
MTVIQLCGRHREENYSPKLAQAKKAKPYLKNNI